MFDVQQPDVGTTARPRRRWLRWSLGVALVVALTGGFVIWWELRPPKPVSVNDVVDRYRHERQSPPPTGPLAGPAPGVYLYATTGSERISFGNISHRYPDRTTLTVSAAGCGLRVRWDALAGRWQRWQLCPTATGWRLDHYTDVHKFLYLEDVHDYTCSGDPWRLDATADLTVVCRYSGGVLTSVVHRVGVEQRTLAGRAVDTVHLRVTQQATGKSLSQGTLELWLLPTTGLPVHVEAHSSGSQETLGSHISYREAATFDLVSATPRR